MSAISNIDEEQVVNRRRNVGGAGQDSEDHETSNDGKQDHLTETDNGPLQANEILEDDDTDDLPIADDTFFSRLDRHVIQMRNLYYRNRINCTIAFLLLLTIINSCVQYFFPKRR